MPTKTQLCPPLSPIPIVEPHLMPFHIDYSGSAPISTYFLVKPDSTLNDEPPPPPPPPNALQRLKNRFISAFRGRRLKGLEIDIPEGYVGIVLKGDDENDNFVLPKKRPFSPAKRKKTRRNPVVEEEDQNAGMEEIEKQSVETKILRPVGQFNSFTIWNPDVDIDETNDEYIRALTDYRKLLAEVKVSSTFGF
ncbi:hypothetical protein Clacol_005613 [Clathrus columnatus]|uniref:Uncharacterized protein n=1 Tax=Clathrus columnatus TaxID=1419009 RepID=A0AAV5AEH1_9AGAM|nr:hypothetical protein Clacol_005613 [Clathrus columnatus]